MSGCSRTRAGGAARPVRHPIGFVQRLADVAKGDERRNLMVVANAASAQLKNVQAFIDSRKAGEANDRRLLFNAERYLAYANRTNGSLVLDFDLRLEGLSTVKDELFNGQRLRLARVTFRWYRAYEPNGTLWMAKAARRMTGPVKVDLRETAAGGECWEGERAEAR